MSLTQSPSRLSTRGDSLASFVARLGGASLEAVTPRARKALEALAGAARAAFAPAPPAPPPPPRARAGALPGRAPLLRLGVRGDAAPARSGAARELPASPTAARGGGGAAAAARPAAALFAALAADALRAAASCALVALLLGLMSVHGAVARAERRARARG